MRIKTLLCAAHLTQQKFYKKKALGGLTVGIKRVTICVFSCLLANLLDT
ncbi:MAG: hypothetical protein QXY86_03090 [Candidatus Micrarchaeaceae archaeon]